VTQVGKFGFCFRPIDEGVPECNGKTDGRVSELVDIRIVGYEPPKIIGVYLDFLPENLA
jgi:hypothetical protein